jgi:hypothetical protein
MPKYIVVRECDVQQYNSLEAAKDAARQLAVKGYYDEVIAIAEVTARVRAEVSIREVKPE